MRNEKNHCFLCLLSIFIFYRYALLCREPRRIDGVVEIKGATTGGGLGGVRSPSTIDATTPPQLLASQDRLNHLAVLHAHQEMTDAIDLEMIAKESVNKCDTRLTTFGQ